MPELDSNTIDRRDIRRMIEEPEEQFLLNEMLAHAHPTDIAEWLQRFSGPEKVALFRLLDHDKQAEVMAHADEATQSELLERLDAPELANAIDQMWPDDAVDTLGLLKEEEEDKHSAVYKLLDRELRDDVDELEVYDDETAGGLMTSVYCKVLATGTVGDALKAIKADDDTLESIAIVHIVESSDEGDRLVGVLSTREVLLGKPDEQLVDVMTRDPVTVGVHDDQAEVVQIFEKYGLSTLPVVDERGYLAGVITFDDALAAQADEHQEDLAALAGMRVHDPIYGSIWERLWARVPWLLVTLGGTFITATVLKAFDATLAQIVSTMFFVPAVTAMSGNVGLQSSTNLVRAIALGQVEVGMLARLVLNEMATGLCVGLLCGTLLGFGALLFADAHPELGAIVGIAMVVAITVSSIVGTIVPLLCDRLGIDPAFAAGPVITTLNDVLALSIYLGIATAWISAFNVGAG